MDSTHVSNRKMFFSGLSHTGLNGVGVGIVVPDTAAILLDVRRPPLVPEALLKGLCCPV